MKLYSYLSRQKIIHEYPTELVSVGIVAVDGVSLDSDELLVTLLHCSLYLLSRDTCIVTRVIVTRGIVLW